MANDPISMPESGRSPVAVLASLRFFNGPPAEFWPAFLGAVGAVAGARQAALLLKPAGPAGEWRKLAQWPVNPAVDKFVLAFGKALLDLAVAGVAEGALIRSLEDSASGASQHYGVAVKLQLPRAEDQCVVVLSLPGFSESQAREAVTRVQLAADTPMSYHHQQMAGQAKVDADKFANALDLMTRVNAEKRFLAAALAFCNGLAARHQSDRVSLGWLEHGYVQLKSISRTERFERNMAAVKALEVAMEEAVDQDEEITFPQPAGGTSIVRDHSSYAREQGAQFLCSVPLRLDGEPVAVVTCERQAGPFSEDEVRQLRLACDQAARRLSELNRLDRWFGARWMAELRAQLGRFVGVEHTWAKCVGILGGVALLLVLTLRVTYRVQANFVLRTDEVMYLTAPYDGFIREADVRVSDPVKHGQVLLKLVTDDLILEEAAAMAEVARFTREADKARARGELADMRVDLALADEARARRDLAQYRLGQANLVAPFEGVIIEGDQRERVGAPVKQGEVLFKVGRTEHLYVEADVSERDIHEVKQGAGGEIAFASQPRLKFPVHVERVQPAAEPKETGNVFHTRLAFSGEAESWWRPGMSGVIKIDVGKRALIWILTHRTIDYLRLKLWW